MSNIIWPDYKNCIANVPNSVLKKFGVETVGETLPLLDKYLEKDYKNIVLLLLDGMGKSTLEKILAPDGEFRTHLAGTYYSTFLSTTVAATTSAISGLQPCEHSWLGWDCYYPEIDKNVTVFLNTVQGTEESAADFNVASTFTPYESVVEKLNKAGIKAYNSMPFLPPFPKSIEAVCSEIKERCEEPGKKYIYAYWSEPDGVLHRNGSDSPVVSETLKYLEEVVGTMASELEDTLLIITADHGHIDTDYVILTDYPRICECLTRMPSLEPRVLNFFVKEDMKDRFETEFKKEFGEKFLLMTMDEAIEKKLFGTGKPHEKFRGMLGNYLAIAITDFTIYLDSQCWASMHGSVTEEEMVIPLIIFD